MPKRKVILNVAISLDGFIEDLNGGYDWCFTDQDYGMTEFLEQTDTIFFGRKSYELMLGMEQDHFPKHLKYVFSNTLQEVAAGWQLIKGSELERVETIRQESGKAIWLFGGSSLVKTFVEKEWIDLCMLAVHPLLLGEGKPMFQNLKGRRSLEFVNSISYDSGLIQLFYRFQESTSSNQNGLS